MSDRTDRSRFAGKVALVTGAAQGIGETAARLFAAEGAAVAVVDLQAEPAKAVAGEITAAGGRAVGIEADVSSPDSVSAMADAVLDELGPVTVLASCAAVIEFGAVTEIELDSWRRVMSVNLDGMFLTAKALIPQMQAAGGGAIVNMCSLNATHAQPRFAAYNASKGGVLGLTRQMAYDYGPEIRVNCVSPGVTDTPAVRAAIEADPGLEEVLVQSNHVALRLARPEEIAQGILFLASEEASFCFGTDLMIGGGQTVLP